MNEAEREEARREERAGDAEGRALAREAAKADAADDADVEREAARAADTGVYETDAGTWRVLGRPQIHATKAAAEAAAEWSVEQWTVGIETDGADPRDAAMALLKAGAGPGVVVEGPGVLLARIPDASAAEAEETGYAVFRVGGFEFSVETP